MSYYGLAAANITPITTCPHCSRLVDGSCLVCETGDEHPSCRHCEGGRYKPPKAPFYKNEIFISVATAVTVGVLTTMALRQLKHFGVTS